MFLCYCDIEFELYSSACPLLWLDQNMANKLNEWSEPLQALGCISSSLPGPIQPLYSQYQKYPNKTNNSFKYPEFNVG